MGFARLGQGMPNQQVDVERFLAVGQVAVVQTEPNRKDGPRFPTTFLGWRKGRVILIEHPRTPEGREVAFRDGHPIVLRFIHEGQACAFATEILDWSGGRDSQVRLRWPITVEILVLRRFDRIPFEGPVTVKRVRSPAVQGKFVDLSAGGCGISVDEEITKGENLHLGFCLPDGAVISGLEVTVRMARQAAGSTLLGCEYGPGQEQARNDIGLYVMAVLAHGRGANNRAAGAAAQRVLLVEHSLDTAEKFRRLLARHNIEALVTTNVVDTFYTVRAVSLHGVAIAHDLPGLNGLEVCRLIRQARGLESLPLVLYGGDSLAAEAARVGASRWLPASSSLLVDLVLELKRAMQPVTPVPVS